MNRLSDHQKEILLLCKQFVKEFYTDTPYNNHHYDHIRRVYKTALYLSQDCLKIDLFSLLAATLFHDIGKMKTDLLGETHAIRSAHFVRDYFKQFNLTEEWSLKVETIIKSHSFFDNITPPNIESAILQDADRLDAIGAIGIIRATMNGVQSINNYSHYDKKLLRIEENLNLNKSKELAKNRTKFMVLFLNELKNEIYFTDTCYF